MSTIFDQLTNLILSNIGHLTDTPSGFKKRNCMMCPTRGHNPDKRGRFGIKIEDNSIGMKCFNCNFSAGWADEHTLSKNFVTFLEVIGISDYQIKKIQFELFTHSKNHENAHIITTETNITDSWNLAELPIDSKTFTEWNQLKCNDTNFLKCITYLKDRNLYFPDNLYWTPSKEQQMHKRIILPFTYKERIVGYTGRYYREIKASILPKYINHMPSGYLFNLDKQYYDNKYVIVCEGVFDAFLVHGLSPLGSINEDQIKLINNLNKEVIVSPDRDKSGSDLIDVAMEQGWSVSFPPWGRSIKDAAKAAEHYGIIATVQSIIEHAENIKFNIKLKRRMDKM